MPPLTWTQYTIKDFMDRGEVELQTGPFGTQLHASDYVKSGTTMINARNIGFGEIRTEKLDFLSDDTVKRLSSHVLHTGDLVFGRKGTVERHVLIRPDQDGWFQGTDCLRIRFKSKSINPQFVSYTFLTDYHKQWMINQSSHGATMTSLNQGIISRIPLNLPDIQIQNKIAAILSAHDDLIENNTRRIKILEEMVKAIYREWFVNFRFPGHEGVRMVESELGLVPEGWEVKNLDKVTILNKGISYKGEFLSDYGNPMINLGCFQKDGKFLRDNLKFYTGDYKNHHMVNAGDLVLANTDITQKREILGSPVIIPKINEIENLLFTHHVYALRFSDDNTYLKKFVYFSLLQEKFRERAIGYATGTTILALPKEAVLNYKVCFPPKKIIEAFNNFIQPFFDLICVIEERSIQLKKIRDLLLPKLISGEIDVSELDIRIPEAEA